MIALRIYRSLPRTVRHRMLNLLPADRRLRLIRSLTGLAGAPAPRPVGTRIAVRDGDERLSAMVVDDATPAELWHCNLGAVTAALLAAGIDHFCLPNTDALRSSVAVPADRRAAVRAALRCAPALRGARVVRVRVPVDGDPPRDEEVLRVFFPVTDPRGSVVLGSGFACEIEFWHRDGDMLRAPRHNPVTHEAPARAVLVNASASQLSDFIPLRDSRRYRTRRDFTVVAPDRVRFPIDAVYTWVDGADPEWRSRKAAALGRQAGPVHPVAANDSRYVSRDELRYSLRSLVSYAPWLRRIFLVTDNQLPAWLDPDHPMITVVSHADILGPVGQLPSFNSHAIEARLHRIPGLAEHFLYFNDDVFLGRPLLPQTFFHANGIAKFFMSPAQYGLGDPTADDAPVNAAGKNNRRQINRMFGVTVLQKMKHTPFSLRRSVLEHIESVLPEQIAATIGHQFRHRDDLAVPSSLHHYWAYSIGQAVPGTIDYEYADLGHPSTPARLTELLRHRHRDVFCLNDTDSDPRAVAEQEQMLADFLPRYLPFPAPFELPEEMVAERRTVGATALWRQARGTAGLGSQVDAPTVPTLRVGPQVDAPTVPSRRLGVPLAADHGTSAPSGAEPAIRLGERRDA
ncbi:stealth family protein [Micromonospora coerulea]|uniref:stealth family protein n=1 Tax=Micromonospora coerulea TaxID=47856 RepID=UPI001908FBAD|nr:stealth family protein [Micromonospora veneta]